MTQTALSPRRLRRIVDEIAADLSAASDRGAVANYIPELAKVDPDQFALALVTAEGELVVAGDHETPFSIQSVSKVFTLALALGDRGDAVWTRVGREPSGDPFNSIVQLEHERGRPRNPFINAGAIAVTDMLVGAGGARETIGDILRFVRRLAGDETVQIDRMVAQSEQETGFRNAALANFMRNFGVTTRPPEESLRVYYHQCAIAMTAAQLACAARFLAFDGRIGPDGAEVVTPLQARQINALMLTCGHYDGSGEFAFRVGLPGKSGVGGAIMAVAPGKAAIAAWSPGLNRVGNSQLGTRALEMLAERTGWSVFSAR